MAIAAELGSDVPFCLRGGAAWMRGRGEIIEPVSVATGLAFVVAIPPFRLSTPDVYRAWDELGGPRSERVVPAPRRLAHILPELVNDLEPAAEAVEPRLREFRDALEAATGAPALLAGSGSAYVVPVPDAAAAAGSRRPGRATTAGPGGGDDERVARRATRSLTSTRSGVANRACAGLHAIRRGASAIGPADGAASASSSEASCASSSACACGAS